MNTQELTSSFLLSCPVVRVSTLLSLDTLLLPMSTGKLYYEPKNCGTDCFIAATYAGIELDSEVVHLDTHKTSSGQDFYQINPQGNIPALMTSEGLLSEAPAVLQFADQAPESKLVPAFGSFARYQLLNTFKYIGTEVQPLYAALFSPGWDDAAKQKFKKAIYRQLDCLEKPYIGQDLFLNPQQATILTIYLYVVLTWSLYVGINVATYSKVKQFVDQVGSNSKIKAAWDKMEISNK